MSTSRPTALIAICYDITCAPRRYRVARTLSGYGYRVQFSVYEAYLSKHQFVALRATIKTLIDPREDHVRYYVLGADFQRRVKFDGTSIEPTVRRTVVH